MGLISKKLTLLNAASSVVARVINITVLVWLYQYIVRRISTEEYSVYAVVMSVMTFVPAFTSILTSGVGRYSVEAYAKGEKDTITQITSTMFVITSGVAFLLLILGGVFASNVDKILVIPDEFSADARIMTFLLVFGLALSAALSPFGVGLYVRQKFVLMNTIRILAALLRLGLLLVFLLAVSTRVLWVVVAMVLANTVQLLLTVALSRKLVPSIKFQIGKFNSKLLRKLTSFGGWNFVNRISFLMQQHIDPIILNFFATPFDITVFHLGSIPSRQIRYGWTHISPTVGVPLTAMYATDQKTRMKKAFFKSNRYALWVIMLFVTPAIILHKELMSLYAGQKYQTAGMVMALLLLGLAARFSNILFYPVMQARAEIYKIGIARMIARVFNIALTLYLVAVLKWGAFGAALSSALVMIISEVLLFWPVALDAVDAKVGKFLRETVLPGFLPSLFCGICLFALVRFSDINSWFQLIAYCLIGAVIYLVVLERFCMKPYDRQQLRRLISKVTSSGIVSACLKKS